MRLYQCDRDVEFSHNNREYLAAYVYDADIGKSWITSIADLEVEDIVPLAPDGLPADLVQAAQRAMENEETRQAENAAERAFSDYHGGSGPMSLNEQHAAAWLEKRRLRG